MRLIKNKRIIGISIIALTWFLLGVYYLPGFTILEPQQQNGITSTQSRNAYVFYATQDVYACSALVNIFLLRVVFQTRHRLIIILSRDVSEQYRPVLIDMGVTIYEEEPAPLHSDSVSYYDGCLLKLSALRIHRRDEHLDRVLVLDADQLIVRSLDHLFASPPISFQAPTAYWISDTFLSSTAMLVQPSDRLWGLVESKITDIQRDQYDMDIINAVFQSNNSRLSGSYCTLNSHWEDWNLPIWSEIRSTSETSVSERDLHHLYLESYIVHFTSVGKPWYFDVAEVRQEKPNAHSVLIQQWERWRSIALVTCPAGILDHV